MRYLTALLSFVLVAVLVPLGEATAETPLPVADDTDVAIGAGHSASMALDSQGNPVVAFANFEGRLALTRCLDRSCEGQATTVLTDDQVLGITVAVDSADNPVISYSERLPREEVRAHLVRCSNATCEEQVSDIVVPFQPERDLDYAHNLKMRLDSNDKPVFVMSVVNTGVGFAKCADASCSSVSRTRIIGPHPGAYFPYYELRLDKDDLPVVAFSYEGVVGLTRCTDLECRSKPEVRTLGTRTSTDIPSYTPMGDMILDNDGFPVITFRTKYPTLVGQVAMMHCDNLTCSGPQKRVVVDIDGILFGFSSLEIGASGNPIIAAMDFSKELPGLRFVECSNPSCSGEQNTIGIHKVQKSHELVDELLINDVGDPVVLYRVSGMLRVTLCVISCDATPIVPVECLEAEGVSYDGEIIVGGKRADTLRGTPGNDIIIGLTSGDKIRGMAGDDCILAGPGNDQVFGGAGNDLIWGSAGNDVLLGGRGRDIIRGGNGKNTCRGGTVLTDCK